MLKFPPYFIPDSITGIEVPSYPVSTWASDQNVEWRSLNSCVATHAKMTLNFSSRTACDESCWPDADSVDVVCAAWAFWDETFNELLAFEIEGDHGLWKYFSGKEGCFQQLLRYPYWRWAGKPKSGIADACGIWDLSIDLVGGLAENF